MEGGNMLEPEMLITGQQRKRIIEKLEHYKERFEVQLTKGCGSPKCYSKYCKKDAECNTTSSMVNKMNKTQIQELALRLAIEKMMSGRSGNTEAVQTEGSYTNENKEPNEDGYAYTCKYRGLEMEPHVDILSGSTVSGFGNIEKVSKEGNEQEKDEEMCECKGKAHREVKGLESIIGCLLNQNTSKSNDGNKTKAEVSQLKTESINKKEMDTKTVGRVSRKDEIMIRAIRVILGKVENLVASFNGEGGKGNKTEIEGWIQIDKAEKFGKMVGKYREEVIRGLERIELGLYVRAEKDAIVKAIIIQGAMDKSKENKKREEKDNQIKKMELDEREQIIMGRMVCRWRQQYCGEDKQKEEAKFRAEVEMVIGKVSIETNRQIVRLVKRELDRLVSGFVYNSYNDKEEENKLKRDREGKYLAQLIEVQKIVYELNRRSRRIPDSDFELEQFMDDIYWEKQVQDNNMANNKKYTNHRAADRFRVLDYPFLFSDKLKATIMRIEVHEGMKEKYLAAFSRLGRMGQLRKIKGIDSLVDEKTPSEKYYNNDRIYALLRGTHTWEFSETYKRQIKLASEPFCVLGVRRQNIVRDTFNMLRANKHRLQYPFKVRFVDSGEDGVDMGGVTKEFFNLFFSSVFDPILGLFLHPEPDSTLLMPNGAVSREYLPEYELIGCMLGLALVNRVVLDDQLVAPLSRILTDNICSSNKYSFEDMTNTWDANSWLTYCASTYPTLTKGLRALLEYSDDAGDFQDVFCQTWSITLADPFGSRTRRYLDKSDILPFDPTRIINIPLIPNGSNIFVDISSRHHFVVEYLKFSVLTDLFDIYSAIHSGFVYVTSMTHFVSKIPDLSSFLFGDLSTTVPLDLDQWKAITAYDNGYHPSHPTVVAFWDVVSQFDESQRRNLLAFVTASSRLPLNGFSSLTFVIQKNGDGALSPDETNHSNPALYRLPTSLTCFNRLLLPDYPNHLILKDRLQLAIQNCLGFGLV